MSLSVIPNLLTIGRILAVIPLVWFLLLGRYEAAFIVAILAGLTDALDGYLARRYQWQSRFGGWADPAADKLLMSAGYIALAYLGHLPAWLIGLVIARDAIIAGGALIYRIWLGPFEATPTWLSKATMLMQLLLLWSVLIVLIGIGLPVWLYLALVWTVAILTALTLVQYVWVWSKKAWHRAQAQRMVV